MKKQGIAVIDYGMGNLRSVAKALELVGAKVTVTADPSDIAGAQAVVFPGVGSFGPAIANITSARLKKSLIEAIANGKPFLGICLGFQLLFERSDEAPGVKGLGSVAGSVKKFNFRGQQALKSLKIPHMGWNRVKIHAGNRCMFAGIPDRSYFYFVHSYYGVPADRKVIAGSAEYGVSFCAALAVDRIWACQFHPEKSGATGLKVLKNFVAEARR